MTRFLLLLTALLGLTAPPARAVDESDLLPIEEAFALTATAPERGRIEFTWRVADGYYLYKHRMGAQSADAGFQAEPLALPTGHKKTDEFFGEVETYRGQVTGVLTGTAADGAATATFRVKYQGCADIGVCYPPHVQTVAVALPVDAVGAASAATDTSSTAASPMVGQGPPYAAPTGGSIDALTQALGGTTPLTGTAPGGTTEALPLPPEQAFRFEAIAASPSALLLRFTPHAGYYLYRDRSSFRVANDSGVTLGQPRWPQGTNHRDEHFGDVVVYFDEIEVPLPLGRASGDAQAITLEATFQGCQNDGICYPPMTRQVRVDLPAGIVTSLPEPPSPAPASANGKASSIGLALALLLAFAGGVILNLMPCVLPVLSFKALALAASGRGHDHARSHALWYTAGVLASFAAVGLIAVALRATGQALGWGFQLQQPIVVGVLAYVMFAIGLNLSGVFSIGARLAGTGQALTEKSGPAGDFFTGVLAVVVASPCTAPFMGSALAFAFTASAPVALAVFLALGLGMAVPFLLIGFVPALAQRLPRPGAWMETLKQVLAFPMYLTAVWLLWVLGKQRGIDAVGYALIGLVLLALGLWWTERLKLRTAPVARAFALAVLVLALLPLWAAQQLPAETRTAAPGVEPYSATRLATLRAEGRVVFVNMTADWCVTCKANEKAVLGGADFRAALDGANAVYMKGDWTDVDPEITQFLEAHGAVGVPLYVVFPADGGEGEVLPTVLTDAIVEAALGRASDATALAGSADR